MQDVRKMSSREIEGELKELNEKIELEESHTPRDFTKRQELLEALWGRLEWNFNL